MASDCASAACEGGVCVSTSCSDGRQNGDETATDCGGSCAPCGDGRTCAVGGDRSSGVCNDGLCNAASCSDDVTNGAETGVDCGGDCDPCGTDAACIEDADCASDHCSGFVCIAPTCSDARMNQDETDVDCGGSTCPGCSVGQDCATHDDCHSAVCTAGHCTIAVCGDGRVGGFEECDDGNTIDGDGCDMLCATESVEVLLGAYTTDDNVQMFSAVDGTPLGIFIPTAGPGDLYAFSTPVNVIGGPDGNIYVGDQLGDNVQRFSPTGVFIDEFVGPADGLNNVRGIEFYNDQLYVCSTSTPIRLVRFDLLGGPGVDYTADGSTAVDILFIPDGRMLMAETGSNPDQVRLYAAGGGSYTTLLTGGAPWQLAATGNGTYLVAFRSNDSVVEFDLTGTIIRSLLLTDVFGVAPLDNGNWFVTGGSGNVQVVDPATGAVVATHPQNQIRLIERVRVDPSVVP